MSFFDNIVRLGKSAVGFLTGGSAAGNIVSTILTGFALNQVAKSISKNNNNRSNTINQQQQADSGNKLQLAPATENRIPIVYGRAVVAGIITDAKMSSDNQTMTLCLTICEVTGTKLSDNLASSLEFEDVYINGNRVIFRGDGITTSYMLDADGNIDRSIDGLIKVYCYNNGSGSPTILDNYPAGTTTAAYNIMPGWTTNHNMNSLVFAIVEVTYNRSKNITSIPTFSFKIKNNMAIPGDCLYDYMINTRYGAGIDPTEIKSA
jgi:hypothetical protein